MRQLRTGSTGFSGCHHVAVLPCRRLKEALASWGQSTDRSRWNRTAKTVRFSLDVHHFIAAPLPRRPAAALAGCWKTLMRTVADDGGER